ncbi:MAG: hypothetical protein ABI914_08955 [Acidobacteriota bacterium]
MTDEPVSPYLPPAPADEAGGPSGAPPPPAPDPAPFVAPPVDSSVLAASQFPEPAAGPPAPEESAPFLRPGPDENREDSSAGPALQPPFPSALPAPPPAVAAPPAAPSVETALRAADAPAAGPPRRRDDRPRAPRGPRPDLIETSEPVYRESAGYRMRLEPADLTRLRELPGSKGKTDRELGETFFDGQADRFTASLAEDVPAPADVRVVVDPYSRQAFLAVEKKIRSILSF